MNTLIQDLRFALRMLGKNPGFTAVAVLTLALGIGANTAIFSLIDAVMLRTLPVHDPAQLVVLGWSAHTRPRADGTIMFGDCEWGDDQNPSGCPLPYPFFEEMSAKKDIFAGVTAFAGPADLVMSGSGLVRMVRGEAVSGDYFTTLGVKTVVGRTLGPDDDTPSSAPAAVLSYAYWQTAFGGDRRAVGQTVLLNRVPVAIVGVAEPGFTSLSPGKTEDLFLPLSKLPDLGVPWGRDIHGSNRWWLVIVARMKPGVSLERAQAAATLVFRNQMLHGVKAFSHETDDPKILLLPAQRGLSGRRIFFSKPLYVLMCCVGFVLLIACANLSGLLLARATARQKEMAVRLALGARRGTVVRQLLTESLMLSLAGAALGSLLAIGGVRAMTTLVLGTADDPFPFVVEPNWYALAFTTLISLFCGILFGLVPAIRSSRQSLTSGLKDNAPTFVRPESRWKWRWHLEKPLVVAQMGLSMIVLVGAGLMVRTLQNLHSIDPGFDARNVLLFRISPTLAKYKDVQIQSLYRDLQGRIAALPGVVSVSYSSYALLSGALQNSELHVEGHPASTQQRVDMLGIGPEFLQTLRIPLLTGRTFTAADFNEAARATAEETTQQPSSHAAAETTAASSAGTGTVVPALVNSTFVRHYLANQNPLGKLLSQDVTRAMNGPGVGRAKLRRWEIVGVVGDTKQSDLRREINPAMYVPLTAGGADFEIRTALSPLSLIPSLRQVARALDSNLPLFKVRTQSESIEALLTQERVIARLASCFGFLALVLACVGLYGLLSYEVTRRTREIGIRMSLGADRRNVTRLILRRGMGLAAGGVFAGALGGLAFTRVLSSFLYNVKPTDSLTYLFVAILLTGVALLASYVPARRATRVDPMVALRYE
jgi:predicted permease